MLKIRIALGVLKPAPVHLEISPEYKNLGPFYFYWRKERQWNDFSIKRNFEINNATRAASKANSISV